jgi:hypothetical protein
MVGYTWVEYCGGNVVCCMWVLLFCWAPLHSGSPNQVNPAANHVIWGSRFGGQCIRKRPGGTLLPGVSNGFRIPGVAMGHKHSDIKHGENHTYIHTYIHTHTYTHTYICICVYVYMYICICIYGNKYDSDLLGLAELEVIGRAERGSPARGPRTWQRVAVAVLTWGIC